MKSNLLKIADDLRSSYWFLPSIMAFAAIALATGMVAIDSRYGSHWMTAVPFLYSARPDGARQLLSSIGGSMITVAGTVFSVTIAAVVYASGQYGPRLLSNFMSDRGNQVTLGTFIATFVYCLMVLRTIQSADENNNRVGFVPNDALMVAVVLALCSIAVLIFFIHHVPSKLHINSVIEDIGDRLLGEIDHRFPADLGGRHLDDDGSHDGAKVPATFRQNASTEEAGRRMLIAAKKTGYVQLVDNDTLMDAAHDHDLVLRMQYQPGDFVHTGRILVEAWPPEHCDEEASRAVRAAFSIGARRSALQDLRFLIDELVEIAARALSPGVNDPFTAITCLDWLGAALSDLAGRQLPSHLRADDDGALRVIAHPQTFALFVDRALGALTQYCAEDMNAALRYIRALGEISIDCEDADRLACLGSYLDHLEALCEKSLDGYNLRQVSDRASELRHALAEPDYRRHLRDTTAWLGGTA